MELYLTDLEVEVLAGYLGQILEADDNREIYNVYVRLTNEMGGK